MLYGRSCDLCILGIFGRSLFCGSLWIGMVSYLFYHLWKTTIVWTSVYSVVYISVLATSGPYFQHHTIICSTEVSSASLLSSARGVTTSTNIERQRHCPQCEGYQISRILSTMASTTPLFGRISLDFPVVLYVGYRSRPTSMYRDPRKDLPWRYHRLNLSRNISSLPIVQL